MPTFLSRDEKRDRDKSEIRKYNEDREQILNDPSLPDVQKNKKIKALEITRINKRWITNNSLWWGADDFRIEKFEINKELDLAVGQIKDFRSRTSNRLSGVPRSGID